MIKILLLTSMAVASPSIAIGQTAPSAGSHAEVQPASDAAVSSAPVPAARGPALTVALEAARVSVDTCSAKGFSVGASVVDAAGVLKVVLAADGAAPRGVQSSTNKAVTAVTFKDSTSRLGERSKTDKPLADAIAANPSYNTRAGGILIVVNGEIIGAIGVGGGRPSETDESCALSGLEHIRRLLK